jgi:thiamine transporter
VAVAAALATVLGFIRLYRLPWGGSLSLKILPLLFLAFRRGPKAGAGAGLTSGIITLVLDPVILHPFQVILDYFFPYLAFGVAGWFRTAPRWGICVTSIIRLVFHVLSGVIFFAAYAPEGLNRRTYQFLVDYTGLAFPALLQDGITPWIYAILYNCSVILPELILMILIIPYVLKRLGKLNS